MPLAQDSARPTLGLTVVGTTTRDVLKMMRETHLPFGKDANGRRYELGPVPAEGGGILIGLSRITRSDGRRYDGPHGKGVYYG